MQDRNAKESLNQDNKNNLSLDNYFLRGVAGSASSAIGVHHGFRCYGCSPYLIGAAMGVSIYASQRLYSFQSTKHEGLNVHNEAIIQGSIGGIFYGASFKLSRAVYENFLGRTSTYSVDYLTAENQFWRMYSKQIVRTGIWGFILPVIASVAWDRAATSHSNSNFAFFRKHDIEKTTSPHEACREKKQGLKA